MINLNSKFGKCTDKKCTTTASFGFKDEKSTKCAAHKEKWMYHSKNRSKLCLFESCSSLAHYDGYCFDYNDDNLVPSHPIYESFEMEFGGKKLKFVPMEQLPNSYSP